MKQDTQFVGRKTMGLDLGDRQSYFVVIESLEGKKVEEGSFATSVEGLRESFSSRSPMRVALEVGSHSPWVSRELHAMGHEVIVANPRKFRLISANESKSDRVDAELLARAARMDPKLLHPVWHRDQGKQQDLLLLRSRRALVRTRAGLVNYVHGAIKGFGIRLPLHGPAYLPGKAAARIPSFLQGALGPILRAIEGITREIVSLEKQIAKVAAKRYPQTKLLEEVPGVGPITSLTFVLTLGEPGRFKRSRLVGSYLGLRPRQADSSDSHPQLPITRAGNGELRALLVQCAQQILRPRGPDNDLRRYGQRIAQRGGKNARKRAVVAVARKLAVLLHQLWKSGQAYEPLRQGQALPRQSA